MNVNQYVNNLNNIDSELKKVFEEININDSDYRYLNIIGSNPSKINANRNLKLNMSINRHNLNNVDPIIEWCYYPDPNEYKNPIWFKSPISTIKKTIEDIYINERLGSDYLNSILGNISESYIDGDNDDTTSEKSDIKNLSDIYEEQINQDNDEKVVYVSVEKLVDFLCNKYGIVLRPEGIRYNFINPQTGKKRGMFINDDEVMGDTLSISSDITTKDYDGNLTSNTIIKLSKEFDEDKYANLHLNVNNYTIEIDFEKDDTLFQVK